MSDSLTQPSGVHPAPHAVRVKICGVTTRTDALAVAAAGADWLGLNFYPPSPRFIEPRCAAEITEGLPDSVEPVGVFVNRPAAEVVAIAAQVGLRIVQLHGDEPPEDLLSLGDLRVVRAFRLADSESIIKMEAYLARAHRLGCAPAAVLVDTHFPGQRGGTGRTIATAILDRLPPLPYLILAGGLTPENVAELVTRVRPWMVDVASGVESSPGRQDHARVLAFVRAAKG